jgi:hypothetical protein
MTLCNKQTMAQWGSETVRHLDKTPPGTQAARLLYVQTGSLATPLWQCS